MLKITDFGIAHAVGTADLTDTGRVTGTARYMSPEQATGAQVSATSDVYSLAVVGYQLLTGHTPFNGAPATVALAQVRSLPPPLPASVPTDLRDLIGRSLDKDPTRRPADGTAMASELRSLSDAPVAPDSSPGDAATIGQDDTAEVRAATALDATAVWGAQPQTLVSGPARPATLVDPARRRQRLVRRGLVVGVAVLGAGSLGVLSVRAATTADLVGQLPATPDVSTGPPIASTTEAPPTTVPPAVSTSTPHRSDHNGSPGAEQAQRKRQEQREGQGQSQRLTGSVRRRALGALRVGQRRARSSFRCQGACSRRRVNVTTQNTP